MDTAQTLEGTRTLEFEQVVKRPVEQVYKAFTDSVLLREWLSNGSSIDAKQDGRLVLWWNDGYQMLGRYTALDENQSVSFSWHGNDEPGPTHVDVTLTGGGDSTTVELAHTGIGAGDAWDELAAGLTKGWEEGLENLASVLETGLDLRIARRPMLGVVTGQLIDDNNYARFKLEKGTQGVVLSSVLDDFGAKDAGLMADDVLHKIGDVVLTGYNDFGPAMEGKKAGDVVEVTFYRDGTQHNVQMTLKGRPILDVPDRIQDLAAEVGKIYDQLVAELDEILDGVSETEADHQPAEGEWNVKQVLAHLVYIERDLQVWLATLASDREMLVYPNNIHARNDAVVAAHPSLDGMRALLRRTFDETVTMLAGMHKEFEDRQSTYFRMGQGLLQSAYHPQSHYAQINAALESARQ